MRDFWRRVFSLHEVTQCLATHQIWWIQSGSNRLPFACHANALPDELWTHISGDYGLGCLLVSNKRSNPRSCYRFGGSDRDRTCYLLDANQSLSQLSYTPMGTLRGGHKSSKSEGWTRRARKNIVTCQRVLNIIEFQKNSIFVIATIQR